MRSSNKSKPTPSTYEGWSNAFG